MIKLEKAEKYRCCNACNSEGTIYNVTILNHQNQGTQNALCLDCLSELVSLCQMALHSEGKVQMVSVNEMEERENGKSN